MTKPSLLAVFPQREGGEHALLVGMLFSLLREYDNVDIINPVYRVPGWIVDFPVLLRSMKGCWICVFQFVTFSYATFTCM